MKLFKIINRKYIYLSILFSFLTGLDTLVMPVIVNSIIDSVQTGDTKGLINATIYGILGYVFIQLNLFIWKTFLAKIQRDFGQKLKSRVAEYALYEETKKEEVENIMYNDIHIIEKQFIEPGLNFIYCLWFSLVSLIYVLFLSWQVSLLFILFSSLTLFLPKFFEKQLQDSNNQYSLANEKFINEMSEFINGRIPIKHYGRDNFFLKKFIAKLFDREAKEYNKDYLSYKVTFIINSIAIIVGILPFGIGGFLAIKGYLSVGELIAIFLASDRVLSPLENAISHWNSMKSVEDLVKKLEKILKLSKGNNVEKHENDLNKNREKIKLEFDNVKVGYTKELLNITSNLPFGKKVLITGPSGIGKSTLFKTIFNEIDSLAGVIKINEKNINQLSKKYLYHNIGYIPQEVIIFDDTIEFNITLGEHFDTKNIESVIKQVGLDNLVKNVGLGYSVGRNGDNLSGGERARLVVARTLIRDYSIILVDEFSASLDNETSSKIRKTFLENKSTILEIAHHYSKQDELLYDDIWSFNRG